MIYKVINIWITPEAYLGLGNEIPVQRRCDQEIELVKWCTEAEQKDDTDIARPHLFSFVFSFPLKPLLLNVFIGYLKLVFAGHIHFFKLIKSKDKREELYDFIVLCNSTKQYL